MAEDGDTFFVKSEGDGVCDDSFTFPVGVGRGFFSGPLETRTPGLSLTALDASQFTSTRYVDRPMPSQVGSSLDLSSFITQLAEQLGKSLTAQLQSDRSMNNTRAPEQPSEMSPSNVKLVMQSDAKEPPIFRGDGSDMSGQTS